MFCRVMRRNTETLTSFESCLYWHIFELDVFKAISCLQTSFALYLISFSLENPKSGLLTGHVTAAKQQTKCFHALCLWSSFKLVDAERSHLQWKQDSKDGGQRLREKCFVAFRRFEIFIFQLHQKHSAVCFFKAVSAAQRASAWHVSEQLAVWPRPCCCQCDWLLISFLSVTESDR